MGLTIFDPKPPQSAQHFWTPRSRSRQRLRGSERSSGRLRCWLRSRVIHPVLVGISVMRNHCSGFAGEGIVIPFRAPVIVRIAVWVRLIVPGMIIAVAVDVASVVMEALSEGAGCEGDCD